MPSVSFVTRRKFVISTAAGLALPWLAPGESQESGPWAGPAVVKRVYLAARRASWPRPDLDLKQEVADIEARLAELERRYPGEIRLTGGELLQPDADIAAWIAGAAAADVVLAFNITHGVLGTLEKLVQSGKPLLLFSKPYAGHDWTHQAVFAQKGMKADVVASSDFAELDAYVRLFRTIHHLRHSKVLLVSPPAARPSGEGFGKQFGTAFAYPTYLDLKAAYEAADAVRARQAAEEFIRSAVRVVEPAREEIVNSLRLHLAIQELLGKERANAIAIDCLGGFGRGELPAYPCVSFSKLNDVGLYGVCECDLDSTMTQLLVTSFSAMPGFVSDPVFDTSRNEVIHAHCVSATAMHGVGRPGSPFMVRSHLEDHQGVSMQVLLPPGGAVTVARFSGPSKFLVSTGEATGNVDDERGCRTKIRTRVANARQFLEGYSAAIASGQTRVSTRDLLHRVVFYGDHTAAIDRLARLLGFQVVREV
jgi:hypothetical protein